MQKYLVLFKTAAGKGREFWEGFSKIPDEPMDGVRIEESYSLFGKWDFVIIFTADSNENALHFIGEKLSPQRNCGDYYISDDCSEATQNEPLRNNHFNRIIPFFLCRAQNFIQVVCLGNVLSFLRLLLTLHQSTEVHIIF
jgi:hypothetical protein